MPGRTSPVLLRRKLGILLRQYREDLDLTAAEVSHETDISTTIISRLETGSRAPGMLYVRELCRHYGLDKDTTDRLIRIARASQENGWWEKFDLKGMTSSYIEFEAGASAVKNYENAYVPGLLQTPEYASAVVAAPLDLNSSDNLIDKTASARRERQQILTGEDPLAFHAIISEAVLHYEPGGTSVHIEQLRHLTQQASLANVTIQVLPNQVKSGLGLIGPFAVLSFDDEVLTDLAYSEGPMGSVSRSEQDYVDRCKAIFAALADQAADQQRSIRIIKEHIRFLEKREDR